MGQPFTEDVEMRHRVETLSASCLPSSAEEQFHSLLVDSARRTIAWTIEGTDRPDNHRIWSWPTTVTMNTAGFE
ncbi:MAG TPA: hypothetical protein VN680_18355 [Burkholderiaceae bacterium]|nr:hypothetical protein [Burkholderiaceae bacterium]